MQAGASDRGREFAARWAEMIFTLQHTKADMQAFYADIKGRMAALGRAPEECAILPSLDPIIGETESIAREKQAYVNELVDTELALALVSAHLGIDLSNFPPDQPIENFELEAGARGSLEVILQGTKAHGLTPGRGGARASRPASSRRRSSARRPVSPTSSGPVRGAGLRRLHPDAHGVPRHLGAVRALGRPRIAAPRRVPHRVSRPHPAREPATTDGPSRRRRASAGSVR